MPLFTLLFEFGYTIVQLKYFVYTPVQWNASRINRMTGTDNDVTK
jgi:hypothetical protein